MNENQRQRNDAEFDTAVSRPHTEVALKLLRGGVVMLACARMGEEVIQITVSGDYEAAEWGSVERKNVGPIPVFSAAAFSAQSVEIGSKWRME